MTLQKFSSNARAVDSSVLIAVMLGEIDAEIHYEAMLKADALFISAVTLVETAIVLENKIGSAGSRDLEEFLRDFAIEVVAVDAIQARAALLAYWRFGRGLHMARLSFGDCFSYALAKVYSLPLLFKGAGFSLTDVPIPT